MGTTITFHTVESTVIKYKHCRKEKGHPGSSGQRQSGEQIVCAKANGESHPDPK